MKTSNKFHANGTLIGQPGGEYFKAWALYLSKFFDSYSSHGVTFWGTTVQNEPKMGFIPEWKFNGLGLTSEHERDFVVRDLVPQLRSAGFGYLKVMIGDDLRHTLPELAETLFSDPVATSLVDGFAVHWYSDFRVPPSVLDDLHDRSPDHFILQTEACHGVFGGQHNDVILGEWDRGEDYARNIMEHLNHWAIGWIDWNLALDEIGGPNWVDNFVDSPIIVNASSDEFYKQPMYYALGHFSKFLPRDSVRIGSVMTSGRSWFVDFVAFQRPDDGTAVILVNRNEDEIIVSIEDEDVGFIHTTLPPRSVQSLLWYTS
jgi:glucosylceramidase